MPAGCRPGVEVDLQRRRGGHHGQPRTTRAEVPEVLLHRGVARPGVDSLRWAGRVGAQRGQAETELGGMGAQHPLVPQERPDRRGHVDPRRGRELDLAAGLERDAAATGKRGSRLHRRDELQHPAPRRADGRRDEVDQVQLELEAHLTQRAVTQGRGPDPLASSRHRVGAEGVVRITRVEHDVGVSGHGQGPFQVRTGRRGDRGSSWGRPCVTVLVADRQRRRGAAWGRRSVVLSPALPMTPTSPTPIGLRSRIVGAP